MGPPLARLLSDCIPPPLCLAVVQGSGLFQSRQGCQASHRHCCRDLAPHQHHCHILDPKEAIGYLHQGIGSQELTSPFLKCPACADHDSRTKSKTGIVVHTLCGMELETDAARWADCGQVGCSHTARAPGRRTTRDETCSRVGPSPLSLLASTAVQALPSRNFMRAAA